MWEWYSARCLTFALRFRSSAENRHPTGRCHRRPWLPVTRLFVRRPLWPALDEAVDDRAIVRVEDNLQRAATPVQDPGDRRHLGHGDRQVEQGRSNREGVRGCRVTHRGTWLVLPAADLDEIWRCPR